MAWVWSQRSGLYLCGILCLLVAALAYTLAFLAPFWVRQDSNPGLGILSLNIGIWYLCHREGGVCLRHDFALDKPYMKAVRILQVLGLLGLVVSVAAAFFFNCRRDQHPRRSVFLELITCLAALLCLSGSMVYLAFTREDVSRLDYLAYGWAFAVSVAASIIAILASILVFIANRRSAPGPESLPTTATAKTTQWSVDWRTTATRGFTDTGLGNRELFRNDDNHHQHHHHHQHPAGRDFRFASGYHEDVHLHDTHGLRPLPNLPPHELDERVRVYPQNVFTVDPRHSSVVPLSHGGQGQGPGGGYAHGREEDWGVHFSRDARNGREVMSTSLPARGHQQDDGRLHELSVGVSRTRHSVSNDGEVYPAASSMAALESSPFRLPRVVVRGYYEPGHGYPEYVIGTP